MGCLPPFVSDGVVVGSAIVVCLAKRLLTPWIAIDNVRSLVSTIRDGIDGWNSI